MVRESEEARSGSPILVAASCAAVLAALLACKSTSDAPATDDPSPSPGIGATAAGTAAQPTATVVGAAAKPKFGVTDVPAIPSERSNPPVGNEWDLGVPVNTQGANARGKGCTMHVLREWLRIYCTGDVIGYEKKEDFGTFQNDYYEQIAPGKFASFVVRLRKGHSQKIRVCRTRDRASLFVNWPPSRDRPIHVALGHGPPCDGSDWGVGYGAKPGDSKRFNPNDRVPGDMIRWHSDMLRAALAECRAGDSDACMFACGARTCP